MGSERLRRTISDRTVSSIPTLKPVRTAKSLLLDWQSRSGNQAVSRSLQGGTVDGPSLVQRALNGRGHALDPATRAIMETRFTQDLSAVRVHTDEPAAASARALNARAYTVGSDVVFDSGEYTPQTCDGQRLLRHELGHVIEQRATGERVQLASRDESVSDVVDATDTLEPKFSGDLDEPTAIGSAGEREHVRDVRSKLEAAGYKVYTKDQFNDVPWLNEAFPDGRKRPDMVAVHLQKRELGAIDVTASSSSGTEMKPGDPTKLPNEWTTKERARFKGNQYRSPDLLDDFAGRGSGEAPATPENSKLHIEKTIDDAEQLARRAPPEFSEFKVFAQDFHWTTGGSTKPIVVKHAAARSTSTSGGGPPRAKPANEAPRSSTPLEKESAPREMLRARAPAELREFPATSELRTRTPGTTERITTAKAIGLDSAKSLKTEANLLRAARLLKFAGNAVNLYGFVSEMAEFTAMASGGLSARGFVFQEHIQLIGGIEREAQQLVGDYQVFTLSLRQFLPALIALPGGTMDAREIAESLNDNLWNLKALDLQLDDRLPSLEVAAREVRGKIAWATTILESPTARVGVVVMTFSTGDLARILAAREDLYRMRGMLDRALKDYRVVQQDLKPDIEALEGWYQRLLLAR